MTVKKTPLPFHSNQDWKKVKVENENINKLSYITMGNITELKKSNLNRSHKAVLTVLRKTRAEVKIQRSIFQGDALSP